MTNNRIDHTGHAHATTPAARAACRKANATTTTPAAAPKTTCRLKTVAEIAAEKAARRVIEGPHCESCGSTDLEDLETGDQGYTACCNEPVAYDCGECYHN